MVPQLKCHPNSSSLNSVTNFCLLLFLVRISALHMVNWKGGFSVLIFGCINFLWNFFSVTSCFKCWTSSGSVCRQNLLKLPEACCYVCTVYLASNTVIKVGTWNRSQSFLCFWLSSLNCHIWIFGITSEDWLMLWLWTVFLLISDIAQCVVSSFLDVIFWNEKL